jgi:hypothetical protein
MGAGVEAEIIAEKKLHRIKWAAFCWPLLHALQCPLLTQSGHSMAGLVNLRMNKI